jgi:isoleucyl-tRNA synthetase
MNIVSVAVLLLLLVPGEPLLTEQTLEHVIGLVAQQGSDVWWTAPIEQLLPPELAHLAPSLSKGEDTMDVWFDSGSSWAGVVQARQQQGLRFPADLYLEGSDQHRGEGGAAGRGWMMRSAGL